MARWDYLSPIRDTAVAHAARHTGTGPRHTGTGPRHAGTGPRHAATGRQDVATGLCRAWVDKAPSRDDRPVRPAGFPDSVGQSPMLDGDPQMDNGGETARATGEANEKRRSRTSDLGCRSTARQSPAGRYPPPHVSAAKPVTPVCSVGPAAQGTRPAAQGTRPAAQRTRPAAQHTRPAAQPSKPAPQPTRPAPQPSKPAPQLSKPTPQPSRPAERFAAPRC